MMKRTLVAALVGGFAAMSAQTLSAQAQNLDAMSPAEMLALAQKEGKVTIYAFTSRIAQIEKAFEAAYPGIDVVPLDISSTQMIARLKSEAQAGASGADVAYISDAPVVYTELVSKGVLAPYVPPDVAGRVPDEFEKPLLANRLSTKVLMYNEEAHPNGPPVKNLWDLTKPEWKGRVVMVDPNLRGDYLDFMAEVVLRSAEMEKAYQAAFGKPFVLDKTYKNAGEQWIAALWANRPVLVRNTDAVNDAVGKKGQQNPPIGITTYSDRRDNAKENRALQVANAVEPSPGILFPAYLGIVRGTKSPAASRLLIRFMMGDESPTGGPGFAPFYVPGDYPTRTDIQPPKDAIALDQFRAWRIDPVKTAAVRQDVADLILSLK
jgi:iron(III) transport system substrate-binding protein